MGFSSKIQSEILVASARHCCVCHRYRGVKVEIHHILPQEQGGQDTFENAIPLCFDCHSDAGHYFAKHPKGTKFSPQELKKHKETWFNIVKENKIPIKEETYFHSRYLITKEFDILKSISQGDLTRFPIKNCLLYPNEILKQFKEIFNRQRYRRLEFENVLDVSPDRYTTKYPDANIVEQNKDEYPHFYHERIPSSEEIKKICSFDKLSLYLIDNELPPYKIAKLLTCYQGECGGGGKFQELFILRPLYMKFIVITNISGDYLKINRLECLANNQILFNESDINHEINIHLPDILIEPEQSIVVPLGMLLADYNDLEKTDNYFRIHESQGDRSIVLDHTLGNGDQNFEYLNTNYLPQRLGFEINGRELIQPLHTFDFKNVYWIDGYWNCGCCPHLFYEMVDKQIVYKGEIFNTKPGDINSHSFLIGKNVISVVIAELEHEITVIKSIFLNESEIMSNIILNTGDDLKIHVHENDRLKITGYYTTLFENNFIMPLIQKHGLISKYKNTFAKQSLSENAS